MNVYQEIYQKRWDNLERVGEIWRVLVRHFFQQYVRSDDRVLDIGCGYCHFLNHIQAGEKVGVDANPAVRQHAGPDVTVLLTDDLALRDLPESHFDCVFLSNFLEHLPSSTEVLSLLHRVHDLVRPGGRVIILQPNFRLLGAAYFDFIDHKTVLTEKSMEEALDIVGLTLEREIVRFLPYTTRSAMPQSPALVRLYLAFSPVWRLLGKQSLFVARKPAG